MQYFAKLTVKVLGKQALSLEKAELGLGPPEVLELSR